MGKSTVQNHSRTVATKGTPHVARTHGATDICRDPPDKSSAPYENFQPTTELESGKTVMTLIDDQPVWTARGYLDASPSQPPHPPHVIGVMTNSNYQQFATPTSWSDDLIIEGDGAVRTNDSTSQNYDNTTGFVDGSALGEGFAVLDEALLLRCKMDELNGIRYTQQGVREEGHYYPMLGWEGQKQEGDPYFIEIRAGDKVELWAHRIDATVQGGGKDPTCPNCLPASYHTRWRAVRSGTTHEVKEGTGVDFVLDRGFTNPFSSERSYRTMQKREATVKGGGVKGIKQSVKALLELFAYRRGPIQIAVEARACTGVKMAKVNVYPANVVDFALSFGKEVKGGGGSDPPALATFKKAIENLNKLADVGKEIFALAGKKFKFQFLVGAELGFKSSYDYCTENKMTPTGEWRSDRHVGLKWEVWFGATPLLEFSTTVAIPLAVFIPWLGTAVAWALEKCNIRGDVEFSFKLQVASKFSLKRNIYDEPITGKTTTHIRPEISGGIVFQTGFKILSLTASFIVDIYIDYSVSEKQKYLINMAFSGDCKVKFQCVILEDTWFERGPYVYEPTPLQKDFGKIGSIDVIEVP